MAIKSLKPTTPAQRYLQFSDFAEVTTDQPYKPLIAPISKTGGRNCYGRVTSWQRGGGHKRRYRLIDFRRDKLEVPATVTSIEYDPNRSANIALLTYADGEHRYIISPAGLKVGAKVVSSNQEGIIASGNAYPLEFIPVGTNIYNVELKLGKGASLVRSAGTFAQLMAKEGEYAQVKLPSGEVRYVHLKCRATIGQVGNSDHSNISIGKAGRTRHLGRRPHVRGVAMNPIDHPHGGGEGKTSGGRHPVTPWGRPTKGYKTRKRVSTDRFIVKSRHA